MCRSTMRENRIEKYFTDRVKKAGGQTRKVTFLGHRGAPDRLVLWPGRAHWVELKRPLTPHAEDHQLREHKRLRDAGQTVLVLATHAEIDEYIRSRSIEA